MAQCRVCGREFDPGGFQVVVPGVSEAFDRVECAEQARSSAAPTASAPPAAVVHPLPPTTTAPATAAPIVPVAADARRPLLIGANLALLAAGTAATVFLWLRVFGADPSSFELTDLSAGAAPAFERATVRAQVSGRSSPRPRPARAAETGPAADQRAPASVQPTVTGGGGTPVVADQPAPPASSQAPPSPGPEEPPATGGSRAGRLSPSSSRGRESGGDRDGDGAGLARGHEKEKGHENAHSSGKGKKKGHEKHQD